MPVLQRPQVPVMSQLLYLVAALEGDVIDLAVRRTVTTRPDRTGRSLPRCHRADRRRTGSSCWRTCPALQLAEGSAPTPDTPSLRVGVDRHAATVVDHLED